MKKSTLLYIGAAIAFLICMTWEFLTFWDYKILNNIPFGHFRFTGFAFIFAAFFLANKANAFNNIEHNRPADYVIAQSKGWKLARYSVFGLIAIMAIVLIGKNVVEYL